jgi:dolichyl-phosphate beta-glucosyltransferase
MTNPFLSVIIPSYNEKSNLKRNILKDVVEFLSKQDFTYEVILSDDGSSDGTQKELKEFAEKNNRVEFLENPHRGKGPTVTAGMLKATGRWRLFTDFDQSTPINEINKLLAYTNQYQVISGSREVIGAKRDKEPFHRHLMGRVFNLIVQLFALPGMLDTQCGFKLFSEKATKELFNKLYIYGKNSTAKDAFTGAFDVELLYLANKLDYKVIEIPITWKHFASNRVNPIKDSLRMFRDIIRIRLADISGKYNT